MVITIGSQKGGCGKTTIATNLAVCLKNSLLIDADPQKSAGEFVNLRGGSDVNYRTETGDLRKTLVLHKKHYSYVIVDVAGRDSRELRSALFVTDLLIIPVFASTYDLATLDKMEYIVDEVRKVNKNLKAYVLLNKLPTSKSSSLRHEAKVYLRKEYGFNIFYATLGDRISYQSSVVDGSGVTESKRYRYAGEEFKRFIIEIGRIKHGTAKA